MIPAAAGLGITPGKVSYTFSPGFTFEQDLCFRIQNNAYLQISPAGDFPKNVKILSGVDENGRKIVTPDDECIKYRFTTPDYIERPGLHRTVIGVTEIVPEGSLGTIGVAVHLEHKIDVFVPYPGKYLEAWFTLKNAEAGLPVDMTVGVLSRGNDTVKSAWAEIMIYDDEDNQIGFVKTQTEHDIKTDDRRDLRAKWDSEGYHKGYYHAKARLIYDELEDNLTGDFKLGAIDVNLVGYTQNVTIGGIQPFQVLLESMWSETIPSVRAQVAVLGNQSKKLVTFETLTRAVEPWATQLFEGYIDTEKAGLGEHDCLITVRFENQTKEYERTIRIIPPPTAEKPGKSLLDFLTMRNLLILMIAILIIVMVVLAISLLRKEKKR
ncbi:hypothetical protein JW826_02890 [Candidatus Woesearchaeota archaeon]|nr:hypothetical protein [Candidatus Woesearchaeota archaeon]